jgi:hypothetical protein
VQRNLRKKLEKYLNSADENIQAIHYRLVAEGLKLIALEKANRGIEE